MDPAFQFRDDVYVYVLLDGIIPRAYDGFTVASESYWCLAIKPRVEWNSYKLLVGQQGIGDPGSASPQLR